MGPHPAVAAIRLAVRRVLHDILNDHPTSGEHPDQAAERLPSPLVLVACSGGADSMALASALAFEAPKLGIRAGGVTVDHGLQAGSDLRAEEVVLRLRELGLDAKLRQYRDGERFVSAVVDQVGMDGFNRVWTSPNTLPTKAEIAKPADWVARVHRKADS